MPPWLAHVGQLTTGELLAQVGLAGVLERFLVWSHSSFWGVFGWMGVWMDARIYTAALAFGVAVVAGCMWQVADRRLSGAKVSGVRVSGVKDRKSASRFTFHVSRFQTWALALLALSALGTLGIYITYNLLFVQPQGRYLFPALPVLSLAVAVGWWTVARWPGAARWAGSALLGAAGVAVLWGVTQEGINTWSLLLFGGGAALLWAWGLALPRLTYKPQRRISELLYALPFAAMAGLSLLALWVYILPQLR
jgi:hypothetical protein